MDSARVISVLPRVSNNNYFVKEEIKQEKKYKVSKKEETEEFVNGDRRNFLKVVAISGGVFMAGSILNKVSKLNGLSFADQGASALGSIFGKKSNDGVIDQKDEDLNSFFQNFRIVKNDKEYVLYNKEGDNILIIDRDA